MRDDAMISNGAGAWRAVRAALSCVPCLALVLALSAVGVRAQGGQSRPSSTNGRDSAGSAQKKRARRVVAGAAAVKKDDAGAVVPEREAAVPTATTTTTPADKNAVEVESPAPAKASQSDRLNTLRAQIKAARTEAERARRRRMLVDYLVALNQKQQAIDELRAMLKEEPSDPVGCYNIGNALARLGETDAAIDAYRKAIDQRRGQYPHALNNLGVMLLRQERWDEAAEALASALKQEADGYAEASYNLGRLYLLRGDADLAIREWTRTLALQPDHADAALALARAYAANGDTERAVTVIDTFTARNGANDELAAARREILDGAKAGETSDPDSATNVTKPAATTNPAPTQTPTPKP